MNNEEQSYLDIESLLRYRGQEKFVIPLSKNGSVECDNFVNKSTNFCDPICECKYFNDLL